MYLAYFARLPEANQHAVSSRELTFGTTQYPVQRSISALKMFAKYSSAPGNALLVITRDRKIIITKHFYGVRQ